MTTRSLYTRAAAASDDVSQKLAKHALASQQLRPIKAMIELAQSDPRIVVLPEQLDRDEWSFNVKNGTLDLQGQTLRTHSGADLITKLAPVPYVPNAPCLTWLTFLDRIMDRDAALVAFLQRIVGYALTGSTREQCLFFLYGTGANGKTTFLNTLSDLFGDYARTTRPETLLAKRGDGIPNDVARLQGARLITAAETEDGKRLAESLVKQITGGDIIAARFLYNEFFEFRFTGKIFLATNYKPELRGSDEAIWRRIHLIPFAVRIPEADRDKDLPAKLRVELPGILAWAVQGCAAWMQNGLDVPQAVRAATDDYRSDMDSVAAFAQARLVPDSTSQVAAKAMYEEYAAYCDETGKVKVNRQDFPKQLAGHGYTKKATAQANVWVGVRVDGGVGASPTPAEPDPETVIFPQPKRLLMAA